MTTRVRIVVGAAGLATLALIAMARWWPPASSTATSARSNIFAADYVGPAACATCHPRNVASWRTSLHASMTRDLGDATVLGDFADVRLDYAGGNVHFAQDGARRTMTLTSATGVVRRLRVTRTIGARALQEYVGVLEHGPEPVGDAAYTTEVRLPFGVWKRAGRWLPQPFFDSWFGAEYAAAGTPAIDVYAPDPAPWASRCAWCHNTYPFELRALRPDVGYGPERHVMLRTVTRDAAAVARIAADNLLPVDELVTVGISCESCHLGGRDHATDDAVAISFTPESPMLAARADAPDLTGGRRSAAVIADTCGQCHSTPAAHFANGGVARNSSESIDLASGACTSAIRCVDCHDPHTVSTGPGSNIEARSIAACIDCHPALATADAQVRHAGHRATQASCLDCHMPRMVQGVGATVRSHHIGVPSDVRMLAAAAPNACNLCHLEQSIAWTLSQLDIQYRRQLAIAPGYGDLHQPVGQRWLGGADRDTRLAAAAAIARMPDHAAALAHLLPQLDAPVAYERMWMLFAVEEALGRALTRAEFDPLAGPAVRARQVQALRDVRATPTAAPR